MLTWVCLCEFVFFCSLLWRHFHQTAPYKSQCWNMCGIHFAAWCCFSWHCISSCTNSVEFPERLANTEQSVKVMLEQLISSAKQLSWLGRGGKHIPVCLSTHAGVVLQLGQKISMPTKKLCPATSNQQGYEFVQTVSAKYVNAFDRTCRIIWILGGHGKNARHWQGQYSGRPSSEETLTSANIFNQKSKESSMSWKSNPSCHFLIRECCILRQVFLSLGKEEDDHRQEAAGDRSQRTLREKWSYVTCYNRNLVSFANKIDFMSINEPVRFFSQKRTVCFSFCGEPSNAVIACGPHSWCAGRIIVSAISLLWVGVFLKLMPLFHVVCIFWCN